jgi:hypothetical protein
MLSVRPATPADERAALDGMMTSQHFTRTV